MSKETYWFSPRFIFGLYYIYVGSFQTPAVLWDGAILYLLWKSIKGHEHSSYIMLIMGIWILFTKLVKMIPHFKRHPEDLVFIPISILFGYLHGFLNIYAAFTLHKTAWGSQSLVELERPMEQRSCKLTKEAVLHEAEVLVHETDE